MKCANLHSRHNIPLVIILFLTITLYGIYPERSAWSVPVRQAGEHVIAVPSSLLLKEAEVRRDTTYDKNKYRKRIAIIDDEPDITMSFEKGLKNNGFENIYTANNPMLFLKNFRPGSYDLLIIDVVMQPIDGFSLYEEIRKIDDKVRVCFITGYAINYQAMREIFPDDIECFIRKPIDIGNLIRHIEREVV